MRELFIVLIFMAIAVCLVGAQLRDLEAKTECGLTEVPIDIEK